MNVFIALKGTLFLFLFDKGQMVKSSGTDYDPRVIHVKFNGSLLSTPMGGDSLKYCLCPDWSPC